MFYAGISVHAIEQNVERPNLLYIFPDQYRLTALSIWSDPAFRDVLSTVGDPVHTPNLDKLAKQGVLFTQACSTSPLSSPNRAMMMTGMFSKENGVDMNCYKGRAAGVPDNIDGFTDVLAKDGYETAYIGKTHWIRTEALFDGEGSFVNSTEAPGGHYVNDFDTYIPDDKRRFGNEYWFQQFVDNHFDAIAYSNRPELVGGKRDGELYRPHRFTTSVEADIIVDYLKNNADQRDPSKPFSLFWAINPPHPPYSKVSDCREEVFNAYYKELKQEEVLLRPNVKSGVGTKIENLEKLTLMSKVYFSLIKSVDDEIGRVLNTLDEEGLSENTIVIFTSDHGEMMGSQGYTGKGVMYDESFLVPFMIRYPNRIKPAICDLMIGATDIMPTILGMMGVGDKLPQTVMGADYSKGIMNGLHTIQKPVSAFYLMKKEKGVRTDRYSYWVKEDGSYMLFNNRKDPYQLTPIKLEGIPQQEAELLKTELGKWLGKAHDDWAKEEKHSDRVTY